MDKIYSTILKLKYFCNCNERNIHLNCHISLAELKGISAIKKDNLITCSQLAEEISLSPSRVSRITDSLVRKGYITRKTKNNDRRSTFLGLTKKGEKIKEKINKEQKNFEQILLSNLSTQEIEVIKKGLKKLEQILVYNTKKELTNARKNIN